MIKEFNVKHVSSDYYHSIIIDLENNICTFGRNKQYILTQVKIDGVLLKDKLSSHGLIIDLDDNVCGFRSNQYDELGLNYNQPVLFTQQIMFKAKIN